MLSHEHALQASKILATLRAREEEITERHRDSRRKLQDGISGVTKAHNESAVYEQNAAIAHALVALALELTGADHQQAAELAADQAVAPHRSKNADTTGANSNGGGECPEN